MTTSSSEITPPISKKPFFIADGVILLVAIFIAWTGPTVLGVPELLGIAACVCMGALLSVAPFVIDYTRREEAAFAARKAQLVALSEQTTSALEKLHALSLERAAPAPLPVTEPPAWIEEFKSLQTRLNTLESTLSQAATTSQAELRQSLDARRTEETRAFTALRESLQNTLAAIQQTTATQTDTLLAATLASITGQNESTQLAFTEATQANRQEFTTAIEHLAARLDEQWRTALSTLETNLTATIRLQVAEEFAEEKASAARRAVAAAALSLEPTPGAAPSGKSRLGRGLESLITSPQAKPSVTEQPADPLLPLSSLESIPLQPAAPVAVTPTLEESTAPSPTPAITEDPVPASPIESMSEQPAPLPKTTPSKREPATVLDPFHIPVNGYADLAQAMDTELGVTSRRS